MSMSNSVVMERIESALKNAEAASSPELMKAWAGIASGWTYYLQAKSR